MLDLKLTKLVRITDYHDKINVNSVISIKLMQTLQSVQNMSQLGILPEIKKGQKSVRTSLENRQSQRPYHSLSDDLMLLGKCCTNAKSTKQKSAAITAVPLTPSPSASHGSKCKCYTLIIAIISFSVCV